MFRAQPKARPPEEKRTHRAQARRSLSASSSPQFRHGRDSPSTSTSNSARANGAAIRRPRSPGSVRRFAPGTRTCSGASGTRVGLFGPAPEKWRARHCSISSGISGMSMRLPRGISRFSSYIGRLHVTLVRVTPSLQTTSRTASGPGSGWSRRTMATPQRW